ncbi:hypothetical protein niasHT_004340 [Heterodera trifolii]|uniref:Uncharacterized protein n=1 Tax=Heterodera trifolii TaxID=157864 RepID=A0ABD2LTH0_9BILA
MFAQCHFNQLANFLSFQLRYYDCKMIGLEEFCGPAVLKWWTMGADDVVGAGFSGIFTLNGEELMMFDWTSAVLAFQQFR